MNHGAQPVNTILAGPRMTLSARNAWENVLYIPRIRSQWNTDSLTIPGLTQVAKHNDTFTHPAQRGLNTASTHICPGVHLTPQHPETGSPHNNAPAPPAWRKQALVGSSADQWNSTDCSQSYDQKHASSEAKKVQ
eukprot:5800760-Pyramimonas_sp.AAC.1